MKTRFTRSGVCLGVVALLGVAAVTACSGQKEAAPPAAAQLAAGSSAADAPIPETKSPYDALPEAARLVMDKPFTGDFDEMIKRRMIRVGVTFNRTHYFIDKGAGARVDVRVVEAVRERSERGPQDGQPQSARGDRADAARSAVRRPRERQGRHGRGDGDRQARSGEARRVLGADAHQRERSGGHRAGSAADRHRGRSGRPGGLRPEAERLLREPHPPERATQSARQAGRGDRGGPGRARRRRHARDGQRRPRADHRRGRLSGRVLEQGVHQHQSAPGHRPAVRRQPGRRVSQGESASSGRSSTRGSGSTARATPSGT